MFLIKISWIDVCEKNEEKDRDQYKISIKLTQNGRHRILCIFSCGSNYASPTAKYFR